MKRPFVFQTLLALCAFLPVFAENTFSIGNKEFVLEFEHPGYAAPFREFVTRDVERVFVPLRDISNVVDMAKVVIPQGNVVGLGKSSGYPTGFSGSISVSNRNDQIVFKMNEWLSRKYAKVYEDYGARSNQVAQLNALLDSINSGTITNLAAEAFPPLVYVPDVFAENVTPEDARTLLLLTREYVPLSASVLEYWTQTVEGSPCLMAGSNFAYTDELGMTLEPICWVYLNGNWKICHPAVARYIMENESNH